MLPAQTASVSTVSPGDTISATKSHLLQRIISQDDLEALLCTSETTAKGQAWPKDSWAVLVAPLLGEDSQKAYFNIISDVAQDYDKLKA